MLLGPSAGGVSEVVGPGPIRTCTDDDFEAVLTIINEAASAYDGVIPDDRWHVPYMPAAELRDEIAAGVRFWGCYEAGGASSREGGGAQARPASGPRRLLGVMGIQDVDEVTLIRHAYVIPAVQGRGVGSRLLDHLVRVAGARPLLVGTWRAAVWAVRFYERHGFELVTRDEKDRLLRRYWRIPERQVETSVVLRLRESSGPCALRPERPRCWRRPERRAGRSTVWPAAPASRPKRLA